MMSSTYFLSTEEILKIHIRMVEEYGGAASVRDYSLLESAVFAPQASFDDKVLNKTLFEQAASLLIGICKNHPFVDGNKRTALASALVFLELNGRPVFATNKEVVDLTLGVACGRIEKSEIAEFFKIRS